MKPVIVPTTPFRLIYNLGFAQPFVDHERGPRAGGDLAPPGENG